MSFVCLYELTPAEGKFGDLREELSQLSHRITQHHECNGVDILIPSGQTDTLVMIEYWRSEDARKQAGAVLGRHAFDSILRLSSAVRTVVGSIEPHADQPSAAGEPSRRWWRRPFVIMEAPHGSCQSKCTYR